MALRLGFIGIGGLGYLQLTTYGEMSGVDVVTAADVSPDAVEMFEYEFGGPGYRDYREMLDGHADDLDAVSIITPHTLHYEQALASLERDLHVLVEKPMVTDIDHAVDLTETAAERDRVLMVGYQRHFHPAFVEIRRIVEEGRIGELHGVNCYLGQDWIEQHRGTWRADPALSGGGQLYDSGSHLIDALLWTSGTRPSTVAAQIEYAEPGVDLNSALSLQLDRDGTSIVGSVGLTGDGFSPSPAEGYVYWGTEGRLTYTDDRVTVAEKDAMTYATDITADTDFHTLNRQKLENFVAAAEGREPAAVPGEVALQITALTEAAYLAADRGCTVDVQPLIEAARNEHDA